jgi:hypothetical protein
MIVRAFFIISSSWLVADLGSAVAPYFGNPGFQRQTYAELRIEIEIDLGENGMMTTGHEVVLEKYEGD